MSYPLFTAPYRHELKVGDKVITIEIGRYSEQAAAAVMASCGGTYVHTTVALGRQVDLGYFPLSVEFAEKLFAGGIIKGSQWVKRDGRPTDDAVLKARVIDRTMRPLFPDGITHEVQIINTVFSFDKENDPDMIGLIASGVGLAVSQIPFDGPVAGLRLGYSKADQQFFINPTNSERAGLDLDLIVSGTADSIVMVEAGANEVSEDILIDGFRQAQAIFKDLCAEIGQIAKEVGKEKVAIHESKVDPEIQAVAEARQAQISKLLISKHAAAIKTIVEKEGKLLPFADDEAALIEQVLTALNPADEATATEPLFTDREVKSVIATLVKAEARRMILEDKVRPDGRATEEIRPIWCEVDIFPRTHGSAMFKRGATQALTITTLGAPSLGQHIEDLEGESVRHYMHHYNMPPFASGEAGRYGAPKRREIGHGALAERALLPMIPSQAEFPYAIHVVTEIVSSNGSTSQASVCGSTMSLMAAGVPIKRPVSGIAMGLISDGQEFVVLSDIQGLEDHLGDMDFKVAGSAEGVTALQMDIKLKGLPLDVLERALRQANAGRMHILGKMMEAISEPRKELSEYAPKIQQITIPAELIGGLIGPGGKMIKSLIEQFDVQIDVDEDEENKLGLVNISSPDQAKITAAVNHITNMMKTVEIGEQYDGTVVRIEPYGAFVNFLPNKDGLVHVSAMSTEYVADPNSIVKLGDIVHVWVADIQDDGKIKLSMVDPSELAAARSERGDRDGGDRGPRSGGSRPPFRGGRPGGDRGPRSGGGGGFRGGRSGGFNRGGGAGGGRSFDR